jgi:aerobic-type carbon monoxide dehydrogenase small subunit (CoxS/CutS family)
MSVEAADDTPLLWAIREQLQMTGTKLQAAALLAKNSNPTKDEVVQRLSAIAVNARRDGGRSSPRFHSICIDNDP